jgi:hypothetical protein
MKYALWTAQAILFAMFMFAGTSKFIMSAEEMQANMPGVLPTWFIRVIGTCEILGSLGMILPGLLRIKPWLTLLAAAGFVPIMTGAVTLTALYMTVPLAILPLAMGVLAVFVAYGRWKVLPLRGR